MHPDIHFVLHSLSFLFLLQEAITSLIPDSCKNRHGIHRATSSKNKPLSYEELLDKPFYTVEGDSGSADDGDLAAAVDYRTMMQNMLFDIRIESPSRLRNLTLADRIASMEWSEEAVSRAVQDKVSCALCVRYSRNRSQSNRIKG